MTSYAVTNSEWARTAIHVLNAEMARTADTNMYRFPLPRAWDIDLYFKDESAHPTGSLKHRLARSLVMYGLVNGRITFDTDLVEASSGSTAISLAYFADLLDLNFIAIVPEGTSDSKIRSIEQYGGRCLFVASASEMRPAALAYAEEKKAVFLDQFQYAERATEWLGPDSVAKSVFTQLRLERFPIPEWIVVGAGTGGTSTTFGRYIRHRGLDTSVAIADPEGSAYYPAWLCGDYSYESSSASKIEGVGRPQVEASFTPNLVRKVVRVPDEYSVAAARFVSKMLGRSVGGSTGTNAALCFQLIAEMLRDGTSGSVVSLICDSGARYEASYYCDAWTESHDLNLMEATRRFEEFIDSGVFHEF